MPTKVEAYRCDYCGRLLKTPHTAATHEAACNYNPAKRHCITCKHGIKAVCEIVPGIDGIPGSNVDVYGPYCGYHKKPISEKPYFIECDSKGGFDTGVGWYPEAPVPFSCFCYENKGKAEWTSIEEYNGGN